MGLARTAPTNEWTTKDVNWIVTGRGNHGLGYKRAWRVGGVGEASGRYMTNGRFENVRQTE